jgi:N-acyl-D-aspartate/D-glutamate deacylase
MQQILRGAHVVDGTGAPARVADVGIEDGRLVAVETLSAAKAEVIDLDGLILAPGFIDIHTHYDAQVLWDPDLTPSSWHGVTSVVMGNCGFGIAPTRPEHRDTIARTLENVEGMSVDALIAGIPWTFETFPDYLETLARLPKRLNVGAFIGHTPLRLYVLGEEAVERAATDEEIQRMRLLVAGAIEAGAAGFATSQSPTHSGAGGRPVPSRLATKGEVFELAGALADAGRGVIQVTPGPNFYINELAELATVTGRPVSWTALLTSGRRSAVAVLEQQAALEGEVWPQIACRPLVMQVTLADPFPFGTAPAFSEILALPHEERASRYADAAWRDRARPQVANRHWEKTTVQETDRYAEFRNGPSLAELAATRGTDPFDVMVDLALGEDLRTRFLVVLANDDEAELGRLLLDDRAVLGLSDAGAHASQLCDSCFSTYLLEHWVRDTGVLTLEHAVHRLTGHVAGVFRLDGRGRIAPGLAADLVAFDADGVGVEGVERVWDLPAGADRLVARSRGVHATWVNGVATRLDGKDLDDARPGRLIGSRS